MAYLRAYAPWAKPSGGSPPSSEQLKAHCEYEYEKLKIKALYAVISFVWVDGQAAEMGVNTTAAELRHGLSFFRAQFSSGKEYDKYVTTRGLTTTDLLAEIKQGLLVELIHDQLEKRSDERRLTTPQRQRVLNAFAASYMAKWTHRTNCAPGDLVPICRQYRLARVPYGIVPNALPLTDLAAR